MDHLNDEFLKDLEDLSDDEEVKEIVDETHIQIYSCKLLQSQKFKSFMENITSSSNIDEMPVKITKSDPIFELIS